MRESGNDSLIGSAQGCKSLNGKSTAGGYLEFSAASSSVGGITERANCIDRMGKSLA